MGSSGTCWNLEGHRRLIGWCEGFQGDGEADGVSGPDLVGISEWDLSDSTGSNPVFKLIVFTEEQQLQRNQAME